MSQFFKACDECDKTFVVSEEEEYKTSKCPHCGHKNKPKKGVSFARY